MRFIPLTIPSRHQIPFWLLNSNDAPNSKIAGLLDNPSAENTIPISDDESIANSVWSGSLLISAGKDLGSGKEGNDDKSVADSLLSASLLVSVDGDVVGPKEYNENKSIAARYRQFLSWSV